MNKIQLSLTNEESKLLSARASQLGYNLTRYIKYLISREATDVMKKPPISVFQMSEKAQRVARKAQSTHAKEKTEKIGSFAELE